MTDDEIEALLREFVDRREHFPRSSIQESMDFGGPDGTRHRETRLDRSFASEYLDELILAVLFRCEEANGMDIIREFTHRFGVQFSPGTVYPHLHSLEEEGVLECQDRVQTKEYHIKDEETARKYIDSVLTQISCLSSFLAATQNDGAHPDRSSHDQK